MIIGGQRVNYAKIANTEGINLHIIEEKDGKVLLVQINRNDKEQFYNMMQKYGYQYCPKDPADGYTDGRFRRLLKYK